MFGKFNVDGGRSYFSANSEQYAIGAKYNTNSGTVYFGALNNSGLVDAVISNSEGTSLMTLQNGGNVGIGTTAPTEKLEVIGNAKVSGAMTVGTTMTIGGSRVIRARQMTSGNPTTKTFEVTNIPADVTEITVVIFALKTNVADLPYIQVGNSTGYLGAGYYFGGTSYNSNGGFSASDHNTAAFLFDASASSTYKYHGKYVLTKLYTGYWNIQGYAQDQLSGRGGGCNYGISTNSLELTKIKIEVAGGTPATVFDGGSIFVWY